jgi:hypothetical protein
LLPHSKAEESQIHYNEGAEQDRKRHDVNRFDDRKGPFRLLDYYPKASFFALVEKPYR